MKHLALLAIFALVPLTAHANQWDHAAAHMGQFEGRYEDDKVSVYYGCSGIGSSVTISVKGNRAGNGKGAIAVDGVKFVDLPLTYDGQQNDTWVEYDVMHGDHKPTKSDKAAYNKFIMAVATGKTMTVTFGDGPVNVPLTNSGDIKACKLY